MRARMHARCPCVCCCFGSRCCLPNWSFLDLVGLFGFVWTLSLVFDSTRPTTTPRTQDSVPLTVPSSTVQDSRSQQQIILPHLRPLCLLVFGSLCFLGSPIAIPVFPSKTQGFSGT